MFVNVDENLRERVEAAAQFTPDVIVTHPLSALGSIFARQNEADELAARTLAAVGWQHVELGSEARYPEVEPESLVGRVDRVLLSSEPYAFRPRDVAEIEAMDRAGHDLKASLIDAEMTSWYGSRAIAGMAYLAKFRKHTFGL